jgi:D-alanyl-D-alanine endopeptidase (penicillin-binding protein 7)
MVVRKLRIDLGAYTEITELDQRLGRGGAESRLKVGMHIKNIDLLRAMLMGSDNRACSALGRAVGKSPKELVAEMNRLARQMGLKHTVFSDPSGLHGNVSTPRELSKALIETMKDPILADIMATRDFVVQTGGEKPQNIAYRNTNRMLHGGRHTILAGKTGFTDPAGYCLIVAARIGQRKLVMALLGSTGKLTRYGDFSRIANWLSAQK